MLVTLLEIDLIANALRLLINAYLIVSSCFLLIEVNDDDNLFLEVIYKGETLRIEHFL
jgi:hypothetical protein